ncbi:hypothetical protein BX666DRAFT_2123167 [Dichotomocladium elegans]|nr:hypothetical protein BX666DRAFT_2123167 [Dichotomocladium elegans]
MNNRNRERKYNSSDNDRLARALSQPVQAWEKKWAPLSRAKNVNTYKWVKSDKPIVFEDEEEEEEEVVAEIEMTEAEKQLPEGHTLPIDPPVTVSLASTLQSKLDDEEEGRSTTPKLDDVSSDVGSEQQLMAEPEEENDINDPSMNPAANPHVHPREEDVENQVL